MGCNGGSVHTFSRVFASLLSTGALPSRSWNVVTRFSGCDSFLVALRAIHQPYKLLSYCDTNADCRAACRAVHPDAIEGCDALTPPPLPAGSSVDLLLSGWPCQPNSDLNLYATDDAVAAGHRVWEDSFDHMLQLQPRAFIMENLPSLLSARLRPVLESIASRLDVSDYTWAIDVLCPSTDGAIATRPRLLFVGCHA